MDSNKTIILSDLFLSDTKLAVETAEKWLVGSEETPFADWAEIEGKRITEFSCQETWFSPHIVVICQTCAIGRNSGICVNCYLNGYHEGHDVLLEVSDSGACDCGNSSCWSTNGFCKHHTETPENPHLIDLGEERSDFVSSIVKCAVSALVPLGPLPTRQVGFICDFLYDLIEIGDAYRRIVSLVLIDDYDFTSLLINWPRFSSETANSIYKLFVELASDTYFINGFTSYLCDSFTYLVGIDANISQPYSSYDQSPIKILLDLGFFSWSYLASHTDYFEENNIPEIISRTLTIYTSLFAYDPEHPIAGYNSFSRGIFDNLAILINTNYFLRLLENPEKEYFLSCLLDSLSLIEANPIIEVTDEFDEEVIGRALFGHSLIFETFESLATINVSPTVFFSTLSLYVLMNVLRDLVDKPNDFSPAIWQRSVFSRGVCLGGILPLHYLAFYHFVTHSDDPIKDWENIAYYQNMETEILLFGTTVLPIRTCAVCSFMAFGMSPACSAFNDEFDVEATIRGRYAAAACAASLSSCPDDIVSMIMHTFGLFDTDRVTISIPTLLFCYFHFITVLVTDSSVFCRTRQEVLKRKLIAILSEGPRTLGNIIDRIAEIESQVELKDILDEVANRVKKSDAVSSGIIGKEYLNQSQSIPGTINSGIVNTKIKEMKFGKLNNKSASQGNNNKSGNKTKNNLKNNAKNKNLNKGGKNTSKNFNKSNKTISPKNAFKKSGSVDNANYNFDKNKFNGNIDSFSNFSRNYNNIDSFSNINNINDITDITDISNITGISTISDINNINELTNFNDLNSVANFAKLNNLTQVDGNIASPLHNSRNNNNDSTSLFFLNSKYSRNVVFSIWAPPNVSYEMLDRLVDTDGSTLLQLNLRLDDPFPNGFDTKKILFTPSFFASCYIALLELEMELDFTTLTLILNLLIFVDKLNEEPPTKEQLPIIQVQTYEQLCSLMPASFPRFLRTQISFRGQNAMTFIEMCKAYGAIGNNFVNSLFKKFNNSNNGSNKSNNSNSNGVLDRKKQNDIDKMQIIKSFQMKHEGFLPKMSEIGKRAHSVCLVCRKQMKNREQIPALLYSFRMPDGRITQRVTFSGKFFHSKCLTEARRSMHHFNFVLNDPNSVSEAFSGDLEQLIQTIADEIEIIELRQTRNPFIFKDLGNNLKINFLFDTAITMYKSKSPNYSSNNDDNNNSPIKRVETNFITKFISDLIMKPDQNFKENFFEIFGDIFREEKNTFLINDKSPNQESDKNSEQSTNSMFVPSTADLLFYLFRKCLLLNYFIVHSVSLQQTEEMLEEPLKIFNFFGINVLQRIRNESGNDEIEKNIYENLYLHYYTFATLPHNFLEFSVDPYKFDILSIGNPESYLCLVTGKCLEQKDIAQHLEGVRVSLFLVLTGEMTGSVKIMCHNEPTLTKMVDTPYITVFGDEQYGLKDGQIIWLCQERLWRLCDEYLNGITLL